MVSQRKIGTIRATQLNQVIALVGGTILLLACPANAFDDDENSSSASDSEARAQAASGVVTSIDAIANTAHTSGAYARSAEYCLEHDQIDKAISLCKLALGEKDDPDLHQIYAEALERKLKAQVDKDPKLFRKCVAEWLIVLRQEGGEESLSFHGLSLPGLGKFYEDEDRTIPAKQHITQLTGRLPKVWETNEKFLNRVTKEAESKVSGKIITGKSNKPQQTKPQEDKDFSQTP